LDEIIVCYFGRDKFSIAAIANAQKQLQLFHFQFWRRQWWPL
jgi:hypothetical protein